MNPAQNTHQMLLQHTLYMSCEIYKIFLVNTYTYKDIYICIITNMQLPQEM